MARFSCAIVFVALLLCFSVCSDTSEPEKSPAERAQETTSYLYDAIRRMAFPSSPILDEDQKNVDNRFILMMPGKVLNYHDYFPGKEYTDFIQVCTTRLLFICSSHLIEKLIIYLESKQKNEVRCCTSTYNGKMV